METRPTRARATAAPPRARAAPAATVRKSLPLRPHGRAANKENNPNARTAAAGRPPRGGEGAAAQQSVTCQLFRLFSELHAKEQRLAELNARFAQLQIAGEPSSPSTSL